MAVCLLAVAFPSTLPVVRRENDFSDGLRFRLLAAHKHRTGLRGGTEPRVHDSPPVADDTAELFSLAGHIIFLSQRFARLYEARV